jgi:glycosyltransferase involved in cell wall biosynthesis
MLTFYIFAMSISPPGTMGGDTKILLEFAKRWANLGCKVTIITSESGYKTFQNYKVNNVDFSIISSSRLEKLGRPLCHVLQTLKACIKVIKSPPLHRKIVIYSATNFWPDVIPAALLKKRLSNPTWIGSCYLPIPSPFKGFEFAYEQKTKILPDLKTLANYLVEKPSSSIMRRLSDYIFVTNDLDKSYFSEKGYPADRLKAIYGGVSLKEIAAVPKQKVKYDGCFVGRIHPMKGVDYLIDIWARVCKIRPDARLALIGNGSKDFEGKIQQEIIKRGLQRNIDTLGYMDGIDKYQVLKSSKVFLHTSIYDNSGMTAAEAMACGLPAVRFDIPALRIAYPKGMLVVPLKDSGEFAKAVLQLLTNNDLYCKLQKEALELAENWDWDKKAGNIFKYITE